MQLFFFERPFYTAVETIHFTKDPPPLVTFIKLRTMHYNVPSRISLGAGGPIRQPLAKAAPAISGAVHFNKEVRWLQ